MIIDLTKDMIDEAVQVGKSLHAESIWQDIPYDDEHVSKYLNLLLDKPRIGFAIAAVEAGKIIGGITANINHYTFCAETYADIHLLYLLPEYRGGKVVIELINAYIERSKQYGVKEIMIGVNSPVNREKVESLYSRMGFECTGTTWSLK